MDHTLLPALQRELLQPPEEGRRQVCHASAELAVDRGYGSAPLRHAPELAANRSQPGMSHVEAVEIGERRRSHHHAAVPSAIDPDPTVQEEIEGNPRKRLLHDHGEVGEKAGHSGDDETTGPGRSDVREHLHLLSNGERFLLAVIHLPKQGP